MHIIHETLTGYNRIHGVHILCKVEPYSGERDKGTPTCPTCLSIDNPCLLSDAERSIIAHFATREPTDTQLWGGRSVTSLHQKDLITKDERLTRRGTILAEDWTIGPAPAADRAGIVHARSPLASWPKCDRNIELDGFDKMTVDRYARFRAINLHVTCVLCASLGFR